MKINCFECSQAGHRRRLLLEEGGITTVSTHNAHILIKRHGLPQSVYLLDINNEQTVRLLWDTGIKHELTGFSWGYRGTGPNGLARFFETIGLAVTLDHIASWGKGLEYLFRFGNDYTGPKVQKES